MRNEQHNDRAARTLLAAAKDGVTASLGADGRILINGTAEAREKWTEAISCLNYEELAGAVLAAFLFNAGRNRHLDGLGEQLIAVISTATAAGITAAQKEVESLEERDKTEPPNAS